MLIYSIHLRHMLQIALFYEEGHRHEKHIRLVHPAPYGYGAFERLLEGRSHAEAFLERPHDLRYAYAPGAGPRAAVAARAVADKGVVRAYLLPEEQAREQVLGIDVLAEVVHRADRRAYLAAQTDREVRPVVAGERDDPFGINLLHLSARLRGR